MPSGVSVRLTDPVAALARGVAQAAVRSAISAAGVKRALDQAQDTTTLSALRETASARVASLTKRQRQILELVLAGYLSP
jgi:FixJ family two-component response regulator